MNAVLDLIPAILFGAAYYFSGKDLYVATSVLIPACIALAAVLWIKDRRLPKMQVAIAVIVSIFGGLTLAFHDPAFIKIKPTILYGAFAAVLLGSQFIGDKVMLARIPQEVLVMPESLWRRLNLIWALFFVFCAALNLFIARHYSEAVWVNSKVYGFSVLMFVFLLLHAPFLSKYFVEPETQKP
jgi:intracellular septation protein